VLAYGNIFEDALGADPLYRGCGMHSGSMPRSLQPTRTNRTGWMKRRAALWSLVSVDSFHGTIAPQTPTGSRSVYACHWVPGAHGTETGRVRPSILFAQPA
jgi:hypothetical protein